MDALKAKNDEDLTVEERYALALWHLKNLPLKNRVNLINDEFRLDMHYCFSCERLMRFDEDYNGCKTCAAKFCENCMADCKVVICDKCQSIFCKICSKGKMANDFDCIQCNKLKCNCDDCKEKK